MKEIIDYLKSFLTYGDLAAADLIGYTANPEEWSNYKVVIIPNNHLGKDIVLPDLGNLAPRLENKTYIVDIDIIYTAFFFISRAEELLVSERDEHGRFNAKYSLLGQHNRLQIPLLDEYSRTVLKLLDRPLPKAGFNHIYLTHDVDTIANYRHLRGFIGGWLRNGLNAVLDSVHDIQKDPAYTFPWLVWQDKKVQEAESIFFIKDTNGKGFDYPQYNLRGKDFLRLKNYLLSHGAKLGLHSSYYGDLNKSHLKTINYQLHRSHYLRCSIDQMQRLADAGITDDFTMSFPDMAGFRLQTSRAVRWINPKIMTLTNLILHPLTVMDVTLSNTNYMHLTEEEAFYYCQQLIEKVRQHHGDLCLLWHNSNPAGNPWQKSIYTQILDIIQ